jgi:DNA-directed RNA polymerase subunit E'
MFYKIKLQDFVALEADLFNKDLALAIEEQLTRDYTNKTVEDFGFVVSVLEILNIGEGFKLPEDSSRHYVVDFEVITFIPEIHEVILGNIVSVTNFGAFVNLGVIEGLVHLSQTMADQASISNTGVIQGNKSGLTLKEGDVVRASIVAVSFKDLKNIKLGLTLRQPGLGNVDWKEGSN